MLLHHEDLEQLSTYTRELSRLLFRSLFGCGVVCGLVVTTKPKCGKVYVTVGAGLALDGNGDPVYLPKDQPLAMDENCDESLKGPLWVVLCGNAKCCAPRTSICASDEEDESPSVCTRERDGYEIRIVSVRPKCICGCPGKTEVKDTDCKCVSPDDPCYRDHYAGKCGCNCDDGCGCDCVLLASLTKTGKGENPWEVDHSVRRFVRPVLMRDPQVEEELTPHLHPPPPPPPPAPPPAGGGGPVLLSQGKGKAAAKAAGKSRPK